MPYIETVDELAESLADAVGRWGSCPDSEKASCTQTRSCRLCWTIAIKERMRQAVQRESPGQEDALASAETRTRAPQRPAPGREWLLAYEWTLVRQGTLLIPSEGEDDGR